MIIIIFVLAFYVHQFSLDYEGNVSRIMHSIPQRDSFFSIDAEKVDEWYKSLKLFVDLLYDEAVYFKTEPGSFSNIFNLKILVHSELWMNGNQYYC